MFLSRFLSNRKAPPHTLQGRDSETSESEVATPMYIYYRIYDEDGPTTSKTPAPGDPFLGRIKARSVPPPNRDTVQAVKRTIAKVENIKDRTSPSLLLSPYSRSPLKDADKVSILTRAGPGSTPQEPLAFVAKISDSRAKGSLSSKSGGRLESAGEPDTTPAEIYLYYRLYVDSHERPSKVAIDQEEPSLGRIRAASIVPPHSVATIKRCISIVEGIPKLAVANLFASADLSCNTPIKEGHISFLRTDCPGLSPKKPMVIVLVESNKV